ncbi:hypothetical protein BFM98_07060 [Lysinibacillus sp. AR18-8]|uniref:hypothetical protein n=1 Tax=Lysinibacillus sp. AR18-8 TaxID=1889781 RepID=UPI0008265722|nr:hypothetical protein [Lysinibacillus sp. AR18-8]OCX64792.1 hypothetical protein BFM98_07060 [Lysinibacillus sp. AR18-8]
MNFSRGNRVFFDSTGKILWQTGEIWESPILVQHEEIEGEIRYVDLEVNSYDSLKHYIASINPQTKEPIFEYYPEPEPTEEQKQITQLQEDILLLQTDAKEGGIL